MNRHNYYNYISEKLTVLAVRIEQNGKLNYLDLHGHSENFYAFFFNALFNWKLINLNAFKQNVEAVDLIDRAQKVIIQVSATATKQKIEKSLGKDLAAYAGYSFKFISISKDASELRTQNYKNPHALAFDPANDIYDVASILKIIIHLPASHQRQIFEVIKDELGSKNDIARVETNLASIVALLGQEDWSFNASVVKTIPYNVDKKIIFNELKATKRIIDDYKVFYSRLDKIYAEFDKQGKNKSLSVWKTIQKEYVSNVNELSGDELFLTVIENVIKRIENSANYKEMPLDELDLCVSILVVDAFIRCRIFEEPPKDEINAAA